ncbi:hypothetical protein EG328_009846 [Venturia inaequalis]|uniref:Uncharacterized protein n=2 Tax=Venturia inaequalis TaxID=5025 RepID=A0A8H3V7K0_VENIN|nr:hypothetical protein EG328_009846 [Venturia inaequalis]
MSQPTGIIGSLLALDKLLVAELVLASVCLYPVWCIIYNLYFHPLRHFPGPKLAAATQLYTSYYLVTGKPIEHFRKMHAKYGEVVRTKPNDLSFITDTAWRDIYMHRQGKPQMMKSHRLSFEADPDLFNIISGDDDTHARHRRSLAHAFSDKALKEQEPLIQQYIDLLIDDVRNQAKTGTAFDIIDRLNWVSFDIIGDLAFGEPFGALETKSTHPWIDKFFTSTQMGCAMMEVLDFVGTFWRDTILKQIIIPGIMQSNAQMADFALEKIDARLERGIGNRPDLMSFVLKNNEEGKGMSKKEIVSTFNILVVAGSETIGTALAGALYLLQKNPRVVRKLKEELHQAFANDKEIDLTKTYQLTYLNAVLSESMRLYPPPPVSLRRVVEPEGTTISGYKVPGGINVGIPQPSAYISPTNFSEPRSFIPERWIETSNPKYANDKRAVFKPFSIGARNCVGQNLANTELRLILSRLIYNFEFELENPDFNWLDEQTARIIRVKPPLVVRAKVDEQAK